MDSRKNDERWRLLDHTADVRLEVYGTDRGELFRNAAAGLTELLTPHLPVVAEQEVDVFLESVGAEELLVDWLREILFYSETRRLVFAGTDILELTDTTLKARVFLCAAPNDLENAMDIKGVTYHGLVVERGKDSYCARIVFDI
jgi:SHS2 domain-containing protein